jgi:hypothetical protein
MNIEYHKLLMRTILLYYHNHVVAPGCIYSLYPLSTLYNMSPENKKINTIMNNLVASSCTIGSIRGLFNLVPYWANNATIKHSSVYDRNYSEMVNKYF